MNWMKEFLKDYVEFPYEQFFKKYDGTLKRSVRISELVSLVFKEGWDQDFVDSSDASSHTEKSICIVPSEVHGARHFSVFNIDERGHRWGFKSHLSLEDAIFDKLDRVLNSMLCVAEDSRINK